MSLKKRNKLEGVQKIEPWNETSPLNPSHYVDMNTNFVLRPIGYENIDQAMFNAFDKLFKIKGKQIGVIQLDAEVASTIFQSYEQLNNYKKYINLPYFTMWRSDSSPFYRVSPSYKPVVYVVPKMKPQGLVYEEWITPTPQLQKLTYVFKFLTNYRSSANEFEEQMMRHFKNRRVIIQVDNERFELSSTEIDSLGKLEAVEREGVENQTLYTLTYEMVLLCYLRKAEDIQKRERPNRLRLKLSERGAGVIETVEIKAKTKT